MMKGVSIDVVLPRRSLPRPASLSLAPTTSPRDAAADPSAGGRSRPVAQRARLLLLWKCRDFEDALGRILPERDGWRLAGHEASPEDNETAGPAGEPAGDGPTGPSVEPFGLSSVSQNLPRENFISWFALLQLTESDGGSHPAGQLDVMR